MSSIQNNDLSYKGSQSDNLHEKNNSVSIIHSHHLAWIILVISLLLTASAYMVSRYLVSQRVEDQFHFRVNEITQAIQDRLNIYEQVLWSGVGFMVASGEVGVSREQWASYVKTVDINEHWPGIQGMGFSIPITPENKKTHVENIRAEGFPSYTIKPDGDRALYSTIVYLEPFDWRNQRAFGYDMWSNDKRRMAMKRARDEGLAATSGIVTLVQETDKDTQRGFLTYVPVYKTKFLPTTVEARREQFVGWVYAPFRAGDLMKGILGAEDPSIEFEIFDGKKMLKENMLFDSNKNIHPDEESIDKISTVVNVVLQGRPWTIYFSSRASFLLGSENNLPRFVAIAGILIDVLLFYVIFSLRFVNRRAEYLAKNMTLELEKIKTSLEGQVLDRTKELQHARDSLKDGVNQRTQDLENKVNELEALNKITMGRESRLLELKNEINILTKELGRTPPYDTLAY